MSDWQAPRNYIKGILIPDEVRALMKEGDPMPVLEVKGQIGTWKLAHGGEVVYTGPLLHASTQPPSS